MQGICATNQNVRRLTRYVFALLAMSVTTVSGHADQAGERAAVALATAKAVVARYEYVNDVERLARAEATIERAWDDLAYYHGSDPSISPSLAVIRARAATKNGGKKRVVEAWDTALRLQPATMQPRQWLSLNVAAAHATASVGEAILSSRYFAAARNFAFIADRDAFALQLRLRIQELVAIGGQLPWRNMRDKILDMRRFSKGFTIWNNPRLEALLSEAELRIQYEPETDEKRLELSNLKAKILLAEKGMSESVRPQYIDRIRAFYYAVEDLYAL